MLLFFFLFFFWHYIVRYERCYDRWMERVDRSMELETGNWNRKGTGTERKEKGKRGKEREGKEREGKARQGQGKAGKRQGKEMPKDTGRTKERTNLERKEKKRSRPR